MHVHQHRCELTDSVLKSVVVDCLNGQSAEWSVKDLQLMISIIRSLSNELDSDSLEVKTCALSYCMR